MKGKSHRRAPAARSPRGVFASFLLALSVVVAFCLGSLGMDVAHGVMVRSELQKAVDSGALAGAYGFNGTTSAANSVNTATACATSITGANLSDNLPVSSRTSGTSVKVVVSNSTSPVTVTVTASRYIAPIFARLLGFGSIPVSASSTASATTGLSVVHPGQAYNLAASLDTVPSGGPQAGKPLDNYTGPSAPGKQFSLVLNPQGSKNAAWISDWSGASSPSLTVGATQVNLKNGVVASQVADLSVGQTIVLPLIQGDPPYNKSATVVGIVGFQITSIGLPNTITGYLTTPVCKGVPGMPLLPTTSSSSNLFLQQWAPKSVQLTQ